MPKTKQPTEKQAKALQLIREGVSPVAAMREAGYSPYTSTHPTNNLLRSAAAESVLDQFKAEYLKVGITPQYLAAKTAEWLEATKTTTSLTEPDRVVPDYQTQLKAAELVRRDLGLAQTDAHTTNVQVNNILPILGGSTAPAPSSDALRSDDRDQEDPQP